ncbi:RND transporter [Fulvitalea axinellae]|uniref:RND transporter n=1 Tax=Fulvitalea axinellae TaxID=1182444 RepID=A0AAU9CXK5_9BACT|nr:RND transporter [Fulvitalea axinellae]
MKKIFYRSVLLAVAVSFMACQSDDVSKKKAEWKEKTQAMKTIKEELKSIEAALDTLDPTWRGETKKNELLVELMTVNPTGFQHKIEVRGTVKSRKNVDVSSESMGRLESLGVIEGQKVSQGQLLGRIDSRAIRNQISEVETQMELAKKVYEKRKALWDQNIGSEIQYLEAKNNFESLEAKLGTLKTQLSFTQIRAPFAGTVDKVYVRKGQMMASGTPAFRLISLRDMYVEGEVSEQYVGKFKEGESVMLKFPALEASLDTKISAVGKVIDPTGRTFVLETRLPDGNSELRPNLTAIMNLTDLNVEGGFVVPTRVVQKDNKGDYIYVVAKEKGKNVARKRRVEVASDYKGKTLLSKGLVNGDQVIVEGYRQATPGVEVKAIK